MLIKNITSLLRNSEDVIMYDPLSLMSDIFNQFKTNNHPEIINILETIEDIFTNILLDDSYKWDEIKFVNLNKVLDTICLVNKYNIVVTIPSYITISHFLNCNISSSEHFSNDIKQVIDKSLYDCNMDIDTLNNIVKDLFTSEYQYNVFNNQVRRNQFEMMRLHVKNNGCNHMTNLRGCSSDISELESICKSYCAELRSNLQKDEDSLSYQDLCELLNKFNTELLDNIKMDSQLENLCRTIQAYFNYIAFVELNPNDPETRMETSNLLNLISSIVKIDKTNPIAITNRLFISNILRLTDTKNVSMITKFNKYSLGFSKCLTENTTIDLTESLEQIVETIITSNCCDTDIINQYILSESYKTNYYRELLNSHILKVNENNIPTYRPLRTSINHIDISVSTLTEGFKILNNGNIQLTFNRESSLIDEYTNNHRLLKYNHKLENFEGMKYNLVYLLILIETIENKVIYNSQTNDEDKAEAKKVVRLCKGDLGVYLPIIQKQDKSFDLNKFYSQVKAEQNTIEIDTVQTITGIKLILKTIL